MANENPRLVWLERLSPGMDPTIHALVWQLVEAQDDLAFKAGIRAVAKWLQGDCPHHTILDDACESRVSWKKRIECQECLDQLDQGSMEG